MSRRYVIVATRDESRHFVGFEQNGEFIVVSAHDALVEARSECRHSNADQVEAEAAYASYIKPVSLTKARPPTAPNRYYWVHSIDPWSNKVCWNAGTNRSPDPTTATTVDQFPATADAERIANLLQTAYDAGWRGAQEVK